VGKEQRQEGRFPHKLVSFRLKETTRVGAPRGRRNRAGSLPPESIGKWGESENQPPTYKFQLLFKRGKQKNGGLFGAEG